MTLLRQQDNQPSNKLVPRSVLWTFILITSCFAWWGLANNMTDTLLAAFKRIMSLSDFKTAWIQIAFYGSYFCLALPAAVIIKKWTYKTGILLGLGLFILGALLFFPASKTMNYGFFLLSLYILAGGLSVLETAANPYIIALGPANTGTQRLNFAQSFNPIGSVLGVFLSKWFILSHLNVASADERSSMSLEQLKEIQSKELEAVMEPYVAVALLMVIIWILIAITKMPRCSDTSSGGWKDLNLTLRRLSKNSHFVNTSYLSKEILNFNDESKSKNFVFLNEVGLDPGIDHFFSHLMVQELKSCLLYTSPSPRDGLLSRMPSSA